VRVHGDYWLRENAGASQPGEDPEDAYDEEAPDWTADAPEEATQLMVVSSEYVAKQVMEIIKWRKAWLETRRLPMNPLLDEEQKKEFLADAKWEYHNSAEQKAKQEADLDAHGKKRVKPRMHSRWCRELQRRAGAHQMWHMLSFAGRWGVEFLERMCQNAGGFQTGETTPQQKEKTRRAFQARCDVRLARRLLRMVDAGRMQHPLLMEDWQSELVDQYNTRMARCSRRQIA